METRSIIVGISWTTRRSNEYLWKWHIRDSVNTFLSHGSFLYKAIFRNIQKSDDGSVFVCVVTNEGGETQERVTIHVQGIFFINFTLYIFLSQSIEIPHVYIYPQTITYSHHWNITLTCIGMNGIPRPLLIWRRQNNENPIEQSSTIRSHNGVLNIMTATKADEGIRKWY